MILHVSPDAPAVVQIAANALLVTHIGGAAVGLVAGVAAMAFRKGGSLHRAAGNAFTVGMLAMSGVGAAVAPFLPSQQVPNTLAGVFTFYMVATAWMAVRRRPGEVGRFERGAFAVGLGVAIFGAFFGWLNGFSAHPLPQPQGSVLFVFASVAALAAAGDLGIIWRGGVSGANRIARHLWRMSVALLVAAGSFAGQPRAIPAFLHGSPLLFLPMLAVLGLMIFWLVRIRSPRRFNLDGARAADSIPAAARTMTPRNVALVRDRSVWPTASTPSLETDARRRA